MQCHLPLLILLSLTYTVSSDTPDITPTTDADARSASPDSFLQRLSDSLFGSDKKVDKRAPPPPANNRPSPVYNRPPPALQALPSFQTPVVATRPTGGDRLDTYGAPQAPPVGPPRPAGDSYGAPQAPPVVQKRPPGPQPPRLPPYQGASSSNIPTVYGGPTSGRKNR